MRLRAGILIALMCVFITGALNGASSLQPLYEQGMEAFRAGNYGSSELLFRKIIDSGEDGELRDKTWYYLALSIFNQKKYKSAIFEFNRFLLICTTQDLCIETRYWIAESNFYLKNYIHAIEEYKRFIAQSKNEMLMVSAHDRIAEIYFQQSRYDEAILEWRESININNNVLQNNQRVVKIGEALFLNENYDESLQLMESLLSSRSEPRVEAYARLIIGKIYQLREKHREALKAFYGIPVTLFREEFFNDVQYLKAVSSIALGDYASARSFLESFLLIGKNSEYYYNAKYELGNILIRENDEKNGIELLEEVRNSTKKMTLRSRAALILSRIYLKRDPSEAIPYLEDAVSLDDPEEQKNALLLLSRVYTDVKRFDDAERILGLLISTYPYDKDNDLIQFLLARVALEKNDTGKALEGFQKLQASNASSHYAQESYYYMARGYASLGQSDKAVESLNRYLAFPRTEKKYDATVMLLQQYLSMGDIRNGEKTIWTIINNYSRQDRVDEVIYNFGLSLKGRNTDPRRYFQYIINNYPRSQSAGEILLSWGDEAYQKKDYITAERYYHQYLSVEDRRNAGSVFLYRMMSLSYLERYKEIIALAGDGKTPEVDDYTRKQLALWLGRSYYRTGNFEMAYKTMFTGNLRDYSAEDLVIVARCALEIGDIWTAQAAPALLANDKEHFSELLFMLGKYYLKENQSAAALDFFNKIVLECPATSYADPAALEMSEIYIRNRRYSEAAQRLLDIRDEKLSDKKNALLIISYFRTGKISEAIELTQKNITRLLNQPYGEIVIKENLFYYYLNRDLGKFSLYAGFMGRYADTTSLVNYLSGKLYFDLKKYTTAYYYFYKLSQAESEYKKEALYNLGLISLFEQKNRQLAIAYFKKLAESADTQDALVMKGRLNLSILLNEKGDINVSRDTLSGILNGPENVTLKTQAENLWNYFGYLK